MGWQVMHFVWVLAVGFAGCMPTGVAESPTASRPPGPASLPTVATTSADSPETKNSPLSDIPNSRQGVDWPRFLGATYDNVSPEKGIQPFPRNGLRKLWECELGIGYPPPAIAGGRLFHFDRFGNNCRLTARNAETGAFLWKYEYPTDYVDRYGYDPGPRAAPTVDGDRVFAYGPEGVLICVRVTDGKLIWSVNTKQKIFFHQNFFGVGSAPLADGDRVLIALGGSEKGPRPIDFRDVKPNGTAIVALDRETGKIQYASMNELSSYSSPILATMNGQKIGLYFARGGLLGFDPQRGKQLFHYPWRAKIEESVNASNPVVVGNRILITESYAVGSACLEFDGERLKELWTDADKDLSDKSLMCHWNTPIHVDGYVYGCHGRHTADAEIRCVELATGEVKWRLRRTTRCSLLLVDGHFLSLAESGEVRLFKANPQKYEEVSRWEIPELRYPCWAPPVLSRGLLYLRGEGKLVCYELIPNTN